jgi:hypothetical protein
MNEKTNVATTVGAPAVVVFGLDRDDRPRAAYFEAEQVDLAVKAAEAMGFQVLRAWHPDQAGLISSLPAGRIYANGRGLVPAVRRDLFGKIVELAAAANDRPAASAESPGAKSFGQGSLGGPPNPVLPPDAGTTSALPRHWDEIDVGHLVIGPEADRKEDGWWQAIVVAKNADMFTLRWQAFPRQKKVIRHRFNLGLLYPGPGFAAADHPATRPASAEPSAHYPHAWEQVAVGSFVLAKDDGPVGVWWEAIVLAQDGDAFTLRWRDHPQLPAIVRHRLNLGLLYPNPH